MKCKKKKCEGKMKTNTEEQVYECKKCGSKIKWTGGKRQDDN